MLPRAFSRGITMTDRVATLVVVLEKEIRDDDVEALRKALSGFRGVLEVQLGDVATYDNFYAAKEQARREIRKQLWEALKDA